MVLHTALPVYRETYQLLAWAKKKYKSLNNSRTKAGKLMERIHKEMPALFVHWHEGMFGALT